MSPLVEIKEQLKLISQKGFFNLLTANVFIQIVSFGSQLFVAGILSPEDVGRIKILQTFLGVLTIVGSMGFNSSTLKLCSENRPINEVQSIFRSSVFFTTITTISAYLIVLLLNFIGILSNDLSIRSLIPLALFPLIPSAFFSLYISYHQSQKNISLISNLTLINKVLTVILIVILTSILGIKGYYIAYNISFIALLAVVFLITRNKFKSEEKLQISKNHLKLHWKYAKPSFFSNILSTLGSYADIILISFLINDIKEIGYYSFALTIVIIFKILPSSVQQITIPYFSNIESDKGRFIRAYSKYSKILIFAIVLTCLIMIVIAPFLIDLIFKGKYNPSIQYFFPLAVGWSILQYNQIQAAALFGLGKVTEIAKSQLIMFFINLLLVFISVELWGLLGAAYVSIICSLLNVSILRYYFLSSMKEYNA